MRHASLTLVVLAALAMGACQAGGGAGRLKQPDLPPGHLWAGQALPTGDVKTSVITIEKILPATVEQGDDLRYTIRVKNISPSTPLVGVVVSDEFPSSGFKFESAEPAGKISGNAISWDVGALDPGASAEISVVGRATDMSAVSRCASVSYGPKAAPPAPKPAPAPVAAKPPAPVLVAKLELSKSAPPESCMYDDIPIKLVVKNPGNGPANDVKVVDTLPEGWTVDGKPTLTFNVGALAAGASKELTAKARASKTGKFTNKATATAAGGLTASAASDTVVKKAILEITKTAGSKTEIMGRDAKFTITVKNTGDWVAHECQLKDTTTGADTVGSASDGGAVSGTTVTWNLGDIAPGASKTVTMGASRKTPGTIENRAAASAHCAEPVSAAASVTFIGIPAVLLELADNPDPVPVGGTTTYTIRVTNQGTAPDSDIVITCDFEDSVSYVSSDGPTKGTYTAPKLTFAPVATLAPKAVVTWTVVIKGVKPADSRFKITMNTKETTRPVESNEATRIY
jgi:uncharacterized repeat protein (TIGR01451 family)